MVDQIYHDCVTRGYKSCTMYKKSDNKKKTVAATALLQQYIGLKKKRFAVSAQHVSVRAVALAELMRF